jgi:hypothetical protein
MNDPDKCAAKFTWGDSIRVIATAPAKFRPGCYAALVGVRDPDETEPDETMRESRYTIEYDDGSSLEIAQRYLIPYEADDQRSP